MEHFTAWILAAVVLTSAHGITLAKAEDPQFFWGAAFSSHQVEGGDFNSDWWDWENTPGKIEGGQTTRIATDHYHRYKEDFTLAQNLNLNTIRFSVSWARIEPRPGEFDQKELDHYRDVVLDLRARGIEPVVALHHFTHPKWFHEKGGWLSSESPQTFARFTEKVAEALSPYVSIWITFNEPIVLVQEGYLKGGYPPGIADFKSAVTAEENIIAAHGMAAEVLRKHLPKSAVNLPLHGVGLALNMHVFEPAHDPATLEGKEDLKAIQVLERLSGWAFLEACQSGYLQWVIPKIPALPGGHRESKQIAVAAHSLDWIGLNYYSRWIMERQKENSLGIRWVGQPDNGVYPQGIEILLKKMKGFLIDEIPLAVTESGLADAEDKLRPQFMSEHIESMKQARISGLDVRGYWYWSLTDNFEWTSGFGPRFGLIDIDYSNMKRTVRESAEWYRTFIKAHPNGP